MSYPCQDDESLKGWDVVNKVMPHGKLPIPNNEDYNFNPNTYVREFFQEDGLPGSFEIDITGLFGMEVDNVRVVDEDQLEEVQNVKDLELLRRMQLGDDTDETPPPNDQANTTLDADIDMRDSDDETYDPANPDHDEYF